MTKIEWTDEVWNVATGCSPVGAGCANCYARRLFPRVYRHGRPGKNGDLRRMGYVDDFQRREFSDVRAHPERLKQPLHWKKPRRVFACSMGDLFHTSVPDEFIASAFGVMAACPQHTFLVLTKRPERAREWFRWEGKQGGGVGYRTDDSWTSTRWRGWPLPNVWLGASASTQKEAQDAAWDLSLTPAAVKFLSLEPLIEPVDLRVSVPTSTGKEDDPGWFIVGCESGPRRRPMKIEWAREIVEWCKWNELPVFVKQLDLDGRVSKDMSEWPEDLRVQEFPK